MRFSSDEVRDHYYALPTDLKVFLEDLRAMLAKIDMIIVIESISESPTALLDVHINVTNKL